MAIDAPRERFTGLTWPQIAGFALLAGAIVGVIAFWWELNQDWFPLLSVLAFAGVILAAIAVRSLRR